MYGFRKKGNRGQLLMTLARVTEGRDSGGLVTDLTNGMAGCRLKTLEEGLHLRRSAAHQRDSGPDCIGTQNGLGGLEEPEGIAEPVTSAGRIQRGPESVGIFCGQFGGSEACFVFVGSSIGCCEMETFGRLQELDWSQTSRFADGFDDALDYGKNGFAIYGLYGSKDCKIVGGTIVEPGIC